MSELVAGVFGFWLGGCAATGAALFAGTAVRRRLGMRPTPYTLRTTALNAAIVLLWPVSTLWAQRAIERGDVELD